MIKKFCLVALTLIYLAANADAAVVKVKVKNKRRKAANVVVVQQAPPAVKVVVK
jgi:hypothetical protein